MANLSRFQLTAGLLLAALTASIAQCQTTANWVAGDGDYLTAANWSTGNVPGDEMGVDESAMFDLAAGVKINLPSGASISPVEVQALAGAATLRVTGGGAASFDVQTELSARMSGKLSVEQDVMLTAPQTVVASGTTGPAGIEFLQNAEASLGQLQIGADLVDAADSFLRVNDGASVTSASATINAAGVAQHTASLEVFNATFQQLPGATLDVGADAESGEGIVLVFSSGTLRTGSGGATVRQSGTIRNNSSHVEFLGDLSILGNTLGYQETLGSGATRQFAEGARIELSAGGRAQFDSALLQLDSGQQLHFGDSSTLLTAGGDIALGATSELHLNFDLSALPVLPVLQSGGGVTLAGAAIVTLDELAPPPAAGMVIPIASAALGFSGAFGSWQTPVAPGLIWQTQIVGDTLSLVAIAASPGDFNSDGQVDAVDYALWRETLGSETDLAADADGSGQIDSGDYDIWRQNFGAPSPSSAVSGFGPAVPEPGAALLLAAALALAGLARRGACR